MSAHPGTTESVGTCSRCLARIVVRPGETTIDVAGDRHKEVREVAAHLAKQESKRRTRADAELAARQMAKAGPWISGLFYLTAIAVLAGVVLAIAAVVPLWAVPIVLLGAVVLLGVVGALQLRHDGKLSEKGFLSLMSLALAHIGELAGARAHDPHGS